MKVCLITAPIATDFEEAVDAETGAVRTVGRAPQLGVLSLAAALQKSGMRPLVFHADRAYFRYLSECGRQGVEFANWVASEIVSAKADIYGFSTICSSYPLTIRIAECVRRQAPGCTIVLGGPQASVVDLQTLAAFPWVDMVVRGEADLTFPALLQELGGARRFGDIPGLTYRSTFGAQRTGEAPLIDDLDTLPLPAYDLTGELEGADLASLELGRGCPFSCTFCSTNDFFRRKFRVKSPERMLADMRTIASKYGIRSFDLVHDMFTVDRRRVAAFCDCLIAAGEPFTWNCSARTDCVDDELLQLMARAGCDTIFFGVETGSRRMQRIIDKDLDPDQSRIAVETSDRLGMRTTVSLISGFPEENEDDLRETLGVYMHALRHVRSQPQLNILAPLAGTPLHAKYKSRMVLEDLCSGMSHQSRTQNKADRELVRAYPDIFPNFYLLETPGLDRGCLLELREFLLLGQVRMRWLLSAIHLASSGLLDVFRSWRLLRTEMRPELSGGSLRHYYTQEVFRKEFLGFIGARLTEFESPAVEALFAYHQAVLRADSEGALLPREGRLVSDDALMPDDIPVRARFVHVLELDWDVQSAIDAVKCGKWTGAIRKRKLYRTEESAEGQVRLVEIEPLVARALKVCDGRRAVREAVTELAACFDCPDELRRFAGEHLLESVRAEGLIETYRIATPALLERPTAPAIAGNAQK